MEGSTKEKILEAALALFSQKGYDAVSVEQIAGAVGIHAPSLYKHYRNKKTIFNAIFEEMARRYDQQTASMEMHLADALLDQSLFLEITAEALAVKVRELFLYSLRDPFASRFRRLMTLEQFGSPDLAALYTERYVTRLVAYHERLFRLLMDRGVLRVGDVHAMALQYVAPVNLLLSVCDRQPELEASCIGELEAHVRQFYQAYSTHIAREKGDSDEALSGR